MATYEPRLPGIDPIATIRLTAYLHADGFLSHYEIEARSPANALVKFRAQGSAGSWEHDAHYLEQRAYFEQWVGEASRENRAASEARERPPGPPRTTEALRAAQRQAEELD